MPYPVKGYPELQTSRPQGTAAQLAKGDIDLQDVKPALLSDLEWVGQTLGEKLTIISGYRTDAYSVQVGGFAGDPHTQGIAADVEIGSTPIGDVAKANALVTTIGLVSGNQPGFYQGKPDPEHVQLSGGATPAGNVPLPDTATKAQGAAGATTQQASLLSALGIPGVGTAEAYAIRALFGLAGAALIVLALVLWSKAVTSRQLVATGLGFLAGQETARSRRAGAAEDTERSQSGQRREEEAHRQRVATEKARATELRTRTRARRGPRREQEAAIERARRRGAADQETS